MQNAEPLKRSRTLTQCGAVASGLYILLMAAYSIAEFNDLPKLSGNEFGDFLAGIFSPLAFLWLVLGFFQQGQELRASVHALELQGRELQQSVEQQRQLVEVTREQLASQDRAFEFEEAEKDRLSQPRLEITRSHDSPGESADHRIYTFKVSNFGPTAAIVQLFDAKSNLLIHRKDLFETADHFYFTLELPFRGTGTRSLRFLYVDGRGFNRVQSYTILIDGAALSIKREAES